MPYSLSDDLWIGWGLPVQGTPYQQGFLFQQTNLLLHRGPAREQGRKCNHWRKYFVFLFLVIHEFWENKPKKKKSTNTGPTVVGAKGSKSSRPNKEKFCMQWLIMILCLGAFPTWTQYSVCEGGARGYPEVLSHLSYSHPSSHFSL